MLNQESPGFSRGEEVNDETWGEIRAERDFLLARARCDHLRQGSDVGRSSQAMLLYAMGAAARPTVPGWTEAQKDALAAGSPLPERAPLIWFGPECGQDYPRDEGDLGRCERTYHSAPEHLQERMLPVLEEFRAWVRHGTNRHGWTPPGREAS